MKHLDTSKFKHASYEEEKFTVVINPFEYLDGRKPRLPRKSSKHYKLRADTYFYFIHFFSGINRDATSVKYRVNIIVYCGKDRLGAADLDNYCKAILDGVTATKKVWKDDRQVDELQSK